jgi:hypothetical protein
MFTDRYGEVVIEKETEFLKEIKKEFRSDEWIICETNYKNKNLAGSDISIYITNYGSVYRSMICSFSLVKKCKIKEDTKLPNDYIDFIKSICLMISVCALNNVDMDRNFKKHIMNTFINEHIIKIFFEKINTTGTHEVMDNNAKQIIIKHIDVFISRLSGAELFNHSIGFAINGMGFYVDYDIFILYVIIKSISDKYWNRQCIGQEALKIKKENEELKEKYDEYKINVEALKESEEALEESEFELIEREEEFEEMKHKFSKNTGSADLERERKEIKELKEKLESESGLSEIKMEKERLKKIKEELCHVKEIVAREREQLEKDKREFEEKKNRTMRQLDDIDI